MCCHIRCRGWDPSLVSHFDSAVDLVSSQGVTLFVEGFLLLSGKLVSLLLVTLGLFLCLLLAILPLLLAFLELVLLG